jgi:predicted sulfurtransferase
MERIYRCGLLFLMVALFSCGSGEAQKSISLEPQEFEKQLALDVEGVLLDVRTSGEFGERHLKGAVNIDVRESDFNSRVAKMDKSGSVYVYCLSGGGRGGAPPNPTPNGGLKP